MSAISILLPLASSILSFLFAFAIFRRYLGRPEHHHLLVWGIGVLLMYVGFLQATAVVAQPSPAIVPAVESSGAQ